jgi:hypothetical protein
MFIRHISNTNERQKMSAPANKTDYLILFRGNDWEKHLSPQELENTLDRFMNWAAELRAQGKMKGANPLRTEGKLVSGVNGRTVTDGPFTESKEAIGGYFLLDVEDEEEAVAIAQQCPLLEHGSVVEVRPVAEECHIATDLREKAELVHA